VIISQTVVRQLENVVQLGFQL